MRDIILRQGLMTKFNATDVYAYEKRTAHKQFPIISGKLDLASEASKNFIRSGILNLYDSDKGVPHYSPDAYDGKIDKNEFGNITKKEYQTYVYEMRKFLKTQGRDLSNINIPTYEELEMLIQKGEIPTQDLHQKVNETPKPEKRLTIDPDFPDKYNDETILSIINSDKSAKSKLSGEEHLKIITNACKKHNLDRKIFAELVKQESRYFEKATSQVGAMGYSQLMPRTASYLGLKPNEFYDPQKNADTGAKYLKRLLVKYKGDVKLALAAYNAGEGTVARCNGIPKNKETMNYVSNISERLLAYKA